MEMFCYQCEQTAKGIGCTQHGVCGKDATTAKLQDILVHLAKGIAQYAHKARQQGAWEEPIDALVPDLLFSTITNVNFDAIRLADLVMTAAEERDEAQALYEGACLEKGTLAQNLQGPATFQLASTLEGLIEQASDVGVAARRKRHGDVAAGLQEMITYGLKGACAYLHHADVLGVRAPDVYATLFELLDFVAAEPTNISLLTAKALDVGALNLRAMELLDEANVSRYGAPEPTSVRVTPLKGQAIVVSGHDLADLDALLQQTEGTGINVYTHGEMLPCHAYPGLKKYPHLVGNYGGAWQKQQSEFAEFPGAILMTTNCLMKPQKRYQDRLFTAGVVGWPDVTHIGDRDFAPVIAAAQRETGFTKDGPDQSIPVGFGRHAVFGVAPQVVEAVQAGKIRHFFLIGGCDGAKPGRNYYTEFAQQVPEDCVILTLACGKYRFNKLDFGEIDGIPRLLDCGQCNDAYSAIEIAKALAEAFACDINDLPLSLVLSWYEQKAVAILLTLLHLGIRDIRLGPMMPAFVTEPVLNLLVDQFNLTPISTPTEDLNAILG